MLSCICCGPLPLEGGIPGHINFQDQKARQKYGQAAVKPELTLQEQVRTHGLSAGCKLQLLQHGVHALQRARRVQASIALNQGRLILSGKLAYLDFGICMLKQSMTELGPTGVLTRANAVTTNKRVYQKVGQVPQV